MFHTSLMSRLQSFRTFEAEVEAGSETEKKPEPTKAELAEAERAKITVTEPTDLQPDEETETEETEVEETKEEEVKEKVEEHQKTEEELKAEKAAAKTEREKDRVQRKIDKEIALRKAAQDELKALKAKLAETPEKGELFTKDEADKLATDKANQIAMEKEFLDTCNTLFKEAVKVDKDFKKKIDVLAEEVSPIPGVMIGILSDLENSGEVLTYFTKDEEGADEYEKIVSMVNAPVKMGVALTKLSNKLLEAKKTKPKEISKVPVPPDVPGGKANVVNMDLSKAKDQAEYNRIRAAQIEQRRKERIAR